MPARSEERLLRQRDLVPLERLAGSTVSVIGVGAIGRQVALQAAAMGIPRLELIDHDRVEAVNLGPQGWAEGDLGIAKVNAAARRCRELNSDVEVRARESRFRRSEGVGEVAICCVDSIDTRRLIWQACRDRVRLFIDTRMSAEVIRILTAGDETGRDHYPSTLFRTAEAHRGACTARSTIYTANVAAGLALGQLTRWLRGLPLDADLQLNLLSTELSVT